MNYLMIILIGILVSRVSIFLSYHMLDRRGFKEGSYNWREVTLINFKLNIGKKFLTDFFSVLCIYYLFKSYGSLSNLSFFLLIVFLLVMLFSLVTDLLEGYILDIITLNGFLIVFILNFIDKDRFVDINLYLLGSLFVIVLFGILLYLMPGKMGLGDVKLYLFLGIYLGISNLILVMFISSLLGIVYGVYIILVKKDNGSFVFGPFISYGSLIVVLFDLSFPFI